MPTFFEVYQDYRKDPRSIELSKKKYKQLHQNIKFYYDKWQYKEPVEYKQFTDDAGETWEVRVYPENFARKMKYLIIKFCEEYKKNLAQNEAQAKKEQPPPPAKTIPEKKQRTRKPVPVYTTKK